MIGALFKKPIVLALFLTIFTHLRLNADTQASALNFEIFRCQEDQQKCRELLKVLEAEIKKQSLIIDYNHVRSALLFGDNAIFNLLLREWIKDYVDNLGNFIELNDHSPAYIPKAQSDAEIEEFGVDLTPTTIPTKAEVYKKNFIKLYLSLLEMSLNKSTEISKLKLLIRSLPQNLITESTKNNLLRSALNKSDLQHFEAALSLGFPFLERITFKGKSRFKGSKSLLTEAIAALERSDYALKVLEKEGSSESSNSVLKKNIQEAYNNKKEILVYLLNNKVPAKFKDEYLAIRTLGITAKIMPYYPPPIVSAYDIVQKEEGNQDAKVKVFQSQELGEDLSLAMLGNDYTRFEKLIKKDPNAIVKYQNENFNTGKNSTAYIRILEKTLFHSDPTFFKMVLDAGATPISSTINFERSLQLQRKGILAPEPLVNIIINSFNPKRDEFLKIFMPYLVKEPKWQEGTQFYPSPLTTVLAFLGNQDKGIKEAALIRILMDAGLRVEHSYARLPSNNNKTPTQFTEEFPFNTKANGEGVSSKLIILQKHCNSTQYSKLKKKVPQLRVHFLDPTEARLYFKTIATSDEDNCLKLYEDMNSTLQGMDTIDINWGNSENDGIVIYPSKKIPPPPVTTQKYSLENPEKPILSTDLFDPEWQKLHLNQIPEDPFKDLIQKK